VKFVLISLAEDVFIPSPRYLSAYLRAQGHETTLIYLPWHYTDKKLDSANSFLYPYPESVLEQIAELCKTADLVGISLMTCHFDNAVHITRYLHGKLSAPVIWGGIHACIRPLECLDHADLVCVGEGELGLSQLAKEMDSGKSWQSVTVPGILKRADRETTNCAAGPLIEDINQIPIPDCELEHQYVLYEGKLARLNSQLLAECLGYCYSAMFSRGCPYVCTYCCNNALRNLYQRKLRVRWRSVDNRLAELKAVVKLMPDLRTISFTDDAFMAQPVELLNEFTTKYREQIGLPFFLLTTPRSVTDEKITALAEAGLYHLCVGVQSGSERIFKKLYRRPESLPEVISASRCIKQAGKKLKKQILVRYDFILDNPWETAEDLEASIRLCTELSKPFNIAMFSLTLYPGTDLYQRAKEEGLIIDDLNQVYRSSQLVPKRNYLNGVFAAVSANAPRWVIACLLWRPVQRLSPVSFPYRVAALFEFLKMVRGFFGYLFGGEWGVIKFFFKPALMRLWSGFGARKDNQERARFRGAAGQVAGDKIFTPNCPKPSRLKFPR
jgi:radical SAM superfamily enzyme YgiQ (UPF0313 family)